MRSRSSSQYLGSSPRKRILRVLFFCALAAAILLSVLMLGNILHDRLAQASPLLALPSVSYGNIPDRKTAQTYSAFTPGKEIPGIYYAPGASVLSKAETIPDSCTAAAELYNGISLAVNDDAGLRFAPKAADKTAAVTSPYPNETLAALLKAADAASLRTCAVWQMESSVPDWTSSESESIRAIAAEGFDEILFTTLTAGDLNERSIAAAAALADALKNLHPRLLVGFAVEHAAFTEADLAPLLEKLAMSVDFLAVDFGKAPEGETESAAFAAERADTLYGSIAYYPLRVLVRGSDITAAAQIQKLRDAGIPAVLSVG